MPPITPKMKDEQAAAALALRAKTLDAMKRQKKNVPAMLAWLHKSQRMSCTASQLMMFLATRPNVPRLAPTPAHMDKLMELHRFEQQLPKPDPGRQLAHLMKVNQQLAAELLESPDAKADAESIQLANQLLRTAIAYERSQQTPKPGAHASKPASEPKPEREDGWQRKEIEEMCSAAFKDVEELEASGTLVIPEA